MNAKNEFIKHISNRNIKCASIQYQKDSFAETILIALKKDYTLQDLTNFLTKLDFEYDDGYGGQRLFGTIWYTDGTWSERGEYDGKEWWEYKSCPEISQDL